MAGHMAPYPNELRTSIKLAGFSVRRVSKATNIPESTLHDWAAGNRVIPHEERQILATLLECDVKCLAPKMCSSSLLETSLEEARRELPSDNENTTPERETSLPFSASVAQDTIGVSVSKLEAENGVCGLSATEGNRTQQSTPDGIQQEHLSFSLSPEEIMLLLSIVKGDDPMSFDSSKRDALRSIAATILTASHIAGITPFAMSDPEPWERLSRAKIASSPSTVLNAATLEHFEHLLKISWQLCDQNQFGTAEGVLLSFLPQIQSLPRQEPDTASLASRSLTLQSILAHHHLRLNDKVYLCEQAATYARLAQNENRLVTALMTLAVAYEYTKQPDSLKKRLNALQEALHHSQEASLLVQSRIYSHYAVALAECGRIREAELYIRLSQEVLPDDPRSDPGFTELGGDGLFTFSLHVGLVHIHAGKTQQAFSAFEYYKQHPSSLVIPERFRLSIANGQSQAAIVDNDADRYADLLEDVLVGSVRIGSQKRFNEALSIFQEEMPSSWLLVSRIKQLIEQYGLKREG